MINSRKLFEYGAIIHLGKKHTQRDLESTIGSIMNQSIPARKISVVSWERSFDLSTKWINNIKDQTRDLGALDFTVTDIMDNEVKNIKNATTIAFKRVIDKSIPVMVKIKGVQKKTFIKLSHFLNIRCSDLMPVEDTIEQEKERLYTDERSLVTTFDLVDKCGNELLDKKCPPIFLNSNGYKFHISEESQKTIIEQYQDLELARKTIIEDNLTSTEANEIKSVVFAHNTNFLIREKS